MMKSQTTRLVGTLLALLVSSAALGADDTHVNSGHKISWRVVASGGSTNGSSSSYRVYSTAGQAAVGSGNSAGYRINQGFWQGFAVPCLCGDANGTGSINISDAVFVINYIFGGGPAPAQTCLGDADGSGAITISDAVRLISFIFAGDPAPQCP